MPLPSSTPTPTPSVTPIFCGQGITNPNGFYYYYTDCCGNFIEGETPNFPILLDYSKPYNGIQLLNIPETVVCPTPTPSPTTTITPTITNTPSVTQTQTATPTLTPTNTVTPTPSSFFVFKNDCEVFTLFDMGLECYTIQSPSSPTSYDGELRINVTGGTAPYSYFWKGGQRSPVLFGIPEGQYEVTVVDYYGDYTANTICNLVAIPVTPTPTQTSTPTPSYVPVCSDLCFTAIVNTTTYGPWQFICNGYNNGKFMWTYNSTYNILWNGDEWGIYENDLQTLVIFDTGVIVSTSQSDVPLSSWKFLGTSPTRPVITVVQDDCPAGIPMKNTIAVENTSCSLYNNCDGSIIFTTKYGTPPYQYSINNGMSYQSSNLFNGLCPGTYTTIVKDQNNSILTDVVVISLDQNLKSYVVGINNLGSITVKPSINRSIQTSKYSINILPNLPPNVQVSFDLNINYEIENLGPWSNNNPNTVEYAVDATLKKNNTDIVLTNFGDFTSFYNRPDCSPYTVEKYSGYYTANITMSSGDIITGIVMSDIAELNPVVGQNGCVSTMIANINITVSSLTITGEYCSELVPDENQLIFSQILVGAP